MAKNLYTRKVKYSFVECYSAAASSQEEANAKFDESMKSSRSTPVGCSYGDLEAEIIDDKCEYEDNEEPIMAKNEMEKQDDPIGAVLDEVKEKISIEKMRKELDRVKRENKVLKLGILQTGYVPAEPEFSEYKTAMSYEFACEFNDIMKEFKKECEKGPIDV